jgi:predicted alpha/beta-fold hydrolase
MQRSLQNETYMPPFYLRNPMVQTVLSSSGLRRLGYNPAVKTCEEHVIEAGDGVRLLGYLSRTDRSPSKGLVALLHGWEGSVDSAYILSTGRHLFKNGFDVFRLNFRDHGDSHHLNRGLFLGTLIDEAFVAIQKIAAMSLGRPFHVVGFSMGANFVIRIARMHDMSPVGGLAHMVAINPPLDPMKSTASIDRTYIIRSYFIRKWKRSLARKQALFPGLYDFTDMLGVDNCMDMTEILIRRYTDYNGAEDYFSRYNLKKGYLDSIQSKITLIMSEDDPIISIDDFRETEMNRNVDFILHKYGGHCGYIEGPGLRSWYQEKLVEIFDVK